MSFYTGMPPRFASRFDLLAIAEAKAKLPIADLIGETLPLIRNGRMLVARCPFHSERTPSFTVYPDHFFCFGCGVRGDGLDWVMRTRHLTFREAISYLTEFRAGLAMAPMTIPQAALKTSETGHIWRRCWDEGIDPVGTPAARYLKCRGDLYLPDASVIRFHPTCQRGPREFPGGPIFQPAMLARMTHPLTGEAVGVHRTFLSSDGAGKAPTITRGDYTLKPKTILGTWGTVRLALDEDIGRALGIAEGIENALTAMQVVAWGPVWAAGTQNAIKNFPVLPWIESLMIFADGDPVGLDAARACARRWRDAGREVGIAIPPPGKDWNAAFHSWNERKGVR